MLTIRFQALKNVLSVISWVVPSTGAAACILHWVDLLDTFVLQDKWTSTLCCAENGEGACNIAAKQIAATRSKTAAEQQDTFMLPSCHKQVEAVQKKAHGLEPQIDICKLDSLPKKKASVRTAMRNAGTMNGLRTRKPVVRGSASGA